MLQKIMIYLIETLFVLRHNPGKKVSVTKNLGNEKLNKNLVGDFSVYIEGKIFPQIGFRKGDKFRVFSFYVDLQLYFQLTFQLFSK